MGKLMNNNFDFSIIEKLLRNMDDYHGSSELSKLKNELNKLFPKAKCREILYTINTDKMLFGMRVYPVMNGDKAIEILGDNKTTLFEEYVVELDSKLFDPMLGMNKRELTAIFLHEVGHIAYNTGSIDEIRAQIDAYFAKSGEYIDINASKGYKELIGYALKDALVKSCSIFAKIGNTESIADVYAVSYGYGQDLESAMRKLATSTPFAGNKVDERFIALSWVLRMKNEFNIRRIPIVKTLNKAKQLTASKLEKRELEYATKIMNSTQIEFNEATSVVDNIKSRFSKKFSEFKLKGIRSIKNDIYEMNLRLRTSESPEDLMFIIRKVNTDVAILQDYLTEEISDEERKSTLDALQELYEIRQKAAKEQEVRDRYSSVIQVVYPDID